MIMISNSSSRLFNAWVTILVIALHGITMWAVFSINSQALPVNEMKTTQIIELELVDAETLSGTESGTEFGTEFSIESMSQNRSEVSSTLKADVKSKNDGQIKEGTSIDEVSEQADELETPDQSVTDKNITDQTPIDDINDQNTDNTEEENSQNNENFNENSTSSETKNQADNTNAANETSSNTERLTNSSSGDDLANGLASEDEALEDDLSAMIRAVTRQYNREQAIQRRAAQSQPFWRQVQQDQEEMRAADQAINDLLSLATKQAVAQEERRSQQGLMDKGSVQKRKPVAFSIEQGVWAEDYEPVTSLPLQIWYRIPAAAGQQFEVLLELHVDTKGVITEVQLLESSGNPIIDATATTQVRSGQLEPLRVDGEAVEAIVPMLLVYTSP